MNLVIKSFILSLLAVSSVNVSAVSIRGTRQAPSWWSTHDAVEACTNMELTGMGCYDCAIDGFELCLKNSGAETKVCHTFYQNTIDRCQHLTSNEAEADASFVAIGSSSDGCRVNRDCPSRHICQFRGREDRGTCVRRNPSSSSSSDDTNTCRINRDCPSNHICQFRGREARGTCVRRNAISTSSDDTQTCRRNNDCPDPDTQRCNDAGYCVIKNRMVPRSGDVCTRNRDCGSNRICGSNGHCQRRDMEFAMEQY